MCTREELSSASLSSVLPYRAPFQHTAHHTQHTSHSHRRSHISTQSRVHMPSFNAAARRRFSISPSAAPATRRQQHARRAVLIFGVHGGKWSVRNRNLLVRTSCSCVCCVFVCACSPSHRRQSRGTRTLGTCTGRAHITRTHIFSRTHTNTHMCRLCARACARCRIAKAQTRVRANSRPSSNTKPPPHRPVLPSAQIPRTPEPSAHTGKSPTQINPMMPQPARIVVVYTTRSLARAHISEP